MSETTIHPALDEFDAAMRTPRARLAACAVIVAAYWLAVWAFGSDSE